MSHRESILVDAYIWSGLSIGSVILGILLSFNWAPMLLIGIGGGLLFGWWALPYWRDINRGPSEVTGTVTKHSPGVGGWNTTVYRTFDISVADKKFGVSEAIYDWLRDGEEVVAYYWQHSGALRQVNKVKLGAE